MSGLLTMADDSGLEVDALDGAPGVHSKRFAGDDASDDDRTALVLRRLGQTPWERRTGALPLRTRACGARRGHGHL